MTTAARRNYRRHLTSVIATLLLERDVECAHEERTGEQTEKSWQDIEIRLDALRRRAYALADARRDKEITDAEAMHLVRRPGA